MNVRELVPEMEVFAILRYFARACKVVRRHRRSCHGHAMVPPTLQLIERIVGAGAWFSYTDAKTQNL
jgi:hypothetical protein